MYTGAGPGSGAVDSLDPYAVFSTLDLFRYSNVSLSRGAGILDLSAGDFEQYFSIDGGVTNTAFFSTGAYQGDGRQASHFKDNLGLGIMDPTAAPGSALSVSPFDLMALDVIGYDLRRAATVPVPDSAFLFALGALGLSGIRKRRR